MAVKKKHIRVTASDIENGVRGSFDQCPIWHATYRAWRARRPVAVRCEGVFVGELTGDSLWIAQLPPEAKRFMTAFDKGRSVKPLEFDLVFK